MFSPATFLRRLRPWQVVMATLLFALGVQTAVVAGKFAGHPSGLFRVGSQSAGPAASQWLGFVPYVPLGGGSYDGQYFLFLAYDPFLRHGVERFLDVPAWRARRIGYPLLAWTLALGARPAIACALYAVNLAAVLGCVALLARRMRGAGRAAVWGGAFVLFASTFMVLTTLTCEGVATCGVLLAFLWHERGRPRAALAASLAAVLVKEVCLLWVAALAVSALARRRGWLVAGCAATVGAWLLWGAYVDAHVSPQAPANGRDATRSAGAASGAPSATANGPSVGTVGGAPRATTGSAYAGTAGAAPAAASSRGWAKAMGGRALAFRAGYFTWPAAGAAKRLRTGWGDGSGSAAARVSRQATEAGLMLTLVALGVQGLAGLRRREAWSDPTALLFALCGAAALCLDAQAWSWSGNFARQLYLLPAVALWRLPSAGRWGRGLLAAHVAFGVLRLAAVALNA